jgi:AmmeMemoRadiSam system protein A
MQQGSKQDAHGAETGFLPGVSLPGVARLAIEAWVTTGAALDTQSALPSAGVFVTLRDGTGKLRGCVGSLEPKRPDLLSETARSAVLAATRDPRFVPVTSSELEDLTIEVSVLSPTQPIQDLSDLDPARYGVVVRDSAGRQGLLLPEVPGIDSAALQVEIARRKAGIPADSPVTLSRFEVFKYLEDPGKGAE